MTYQYKIGFKIVFKIKFIKIKFIVVLMCILGIVSVSSDSLALFSDVGVGARPMGMAGAFVAVADDTNAVFWNPAGLTQIRNFEISSTYMNLYGLPINSQSLGLTYHHKFSGGIALGWQRIGDASLYMEDAFSIAAGQELYQIIRLPAAIGFTIKWLNVGYNLSSDSVLSSGFDPSDPLFSSGDNANAFAFDSGLIYQIYRKVKLALAVENIGKTSLTLDDNPKPEELEQARLPSVYRIGAAYTYVAADEAIQTKENSKDGKAEKDEFESGFSESIFSIELSYRKLTRTTYERSLKIGVEGWLNNITSNPLIGVALRGGLKIANDKGTSLFIGTGYRHPISKQVGVEIDYAFSGFPNPLGFIHRVSLSIVF